MISSELPEVLRLSHRIAVMCEGRLTGILPGGPATSQEDIMRLATQRDTVTETGATRMTARHRRQRPLPHRASGAQQKLLAFASLIVLLVFFSLASPNFLQTDNILGDPAGHRVNGVLAIAATLSSSPAASTCRSAR